tara:strand:+ start:1690 stop:2121 length:432 start_codon:yes stop_codon:yes gene_type:complete
MTIIFDHTFSEIEPEIIYDLLRLRSEIFVVEQSSLYLDLDGCDTNPLTRHIWINGPNGPISYLRVLSEPEGVRIGRVATRKESRGQGLATELLRYVVDSTKGKLTLHAQAHLADWYTSLGYVVTGEEFDDGDGIPHVPMTFVR